MYTISSDHDNLFLIHNTATRNRYKAVTTKFFLQIQICLSATGEQICEVRYLLYAQIREKQDHGCRTKEGTADDVGPASWATEVYKMLYTYDSTQ